MAKYIEVVNGTVVNFIEADEEVAAERQLIAFPEPDEEGAYLPIIRGWLYDSETNVFSKYERDIELEWQAVKLQKEHLLKETEPYVFPDIWATYTEEEQANWVAHRNDLRNIESSQEDPADIVWPVSPIEQ